MDRQGSGRERKYTRKRNRESESAGSVKGGRNELSQYLELV